MMWRGRDVLLVATLAVAALAACDRGGGSEGSSKRAPKVPPAELAAAADEVYGTLGAIREHLPDPRSATAQPCPDAEIAKWTPDDRNRRLTLIAPSALARAQGERVPEKSMIDFVTSSYLRYPARDKLELTRDNVAKQLTRLWATVHYVGVVLPVAEVRSGASSEYTGTAGNFDGWLVIYRKGVPGPLCQTRVRAQGAGTVKYTTTTADNANTRKGKAEHALRRDLCHALTGAMRTQLATISGVLELGYVECNS